MIQRILALLCATVLFLPQAGAESLAEHAADELGGFRIEINEDGVHVVDESDYDHNNHAGHGSHGPSHSIDDETYLRVAIIAALKSGRKLKIKHRSGKKWVLVPYEYQISSDGAEYLLVSHVYYPNGSYYRGATLILVDDIRRIKLVH